MQQMQAGPSQPAPQMPVAMQQQPMQAPQMPQQPQVGPSQPMPQAQAPQLPQTRGQIAGHVGMTAAQGVMGAMQGQSLGAIRGQGNKKQQAANVAKFAAVNAAKNLATDKQTQQLAIQGGKKAFGAFQNWRQNRKN